VTAWPIPTLALALRSCKALAVDVGNTTRTWRNPALIASRAKIRNEIHVDRAVAYARAQGWLEVDKNRDVSLTDEGARLD